MTMLRPITAAAFLTGSAVYLAAEAIAASAWKSPTYSYAENWISDLGSATAGEFQGRYLDSPLNVVMNSGFIIQGLLFGLAVLLLSRLFAVRTRTFTVVTGVITTVGYILVGTFHGSLQAQQDGTLGLHFLGATLAILGANVLSLVLGLHWKRSPSTRLIGIVSIILGIVGLVAVVALFATFGSGLPAGAIERASVYTIVVWQVAVAIALLRGLRGQVETSGSITLSPANDSSDSPTTRYITRPEGRIAYDVQGSGPLVVLVPGMGDLRAGYRFLAPELVAAGYTVATTDLRGHGDSDTSFSSYGDPETAGDIEALIDELGGSAVIGGNSLAAGAAVIVAAEHPEKVSGLVLMGPFVRNPSASAFEVWLFRTMMAPVWVTSMWKSYMPTLYKGTKPVDFEEYRSTVIASLKRPGYAKAFSLTTRQTTHDPAETRLGDVAAPTIVIMGDSDPDFKDPAGEAAWIGEKLNASVVMVPDAGHYPQSQRPDITAPAVLNFLASVVRTA